MSRISIFLAALANAFAAVASPHAVAADFAAKGAKASLVVDFRYESAGREADRLDLHEWRVTRTVHVEAQLAAQQPAEWGAAGPDAAQSAKVGRLRAQTAQLADAMAPTMTGVQAVMARCGDDDKCVEREIARLGTGMAGGQRAAAAQKAGAQVAQNAKPEPRVQQWLGVAQKGSYTFDEKSHRVHADPICMKVPGGRCTRDELRKGGGMLPLSDGTLASVEVDLGHGQLTLQLPMVAEMLSGTESITTDEPEGTHESASPTGTHPYQLLFLQSADNQPSTPPFSVPLKGGWNSQSGERSVKFGGQGAQGGTLTIRWRFTAY